MSIRQRRNGATPLQRLGEGEPSAITDTLTIERVSAPDAETPGNSFTVTAAISCQATVFTNCEAAVRFTFGDETRRVPQSGTRDISEAARDTFSATFTMAESSTSVQVEALEQGLAGRFNVEDSAEVPIEAVTSREKTQRQIVGFAPWAVGGGAVGAGAAQLTGRSPVGGGVAGVGAGVTSKVAVDQLGGGLGLGGIVPEFPTTAVLATAALLGTGAVLLFATPLDEIIFGAQAAQRAGSSIPSRR